MPWSNGSTGYKGLVADKHRTPTEVPELMAWPEVPLMALISLQKSLQIEHMVVVRTIINSRVKEDYYDNSANNIQSSQMRVTV